MSSLNLSSTIKLNNNVNHPIIGLGTYLLKDSNAISNAIKNVGYRCLDTAHYYHNHREFGQGVKNSGISRSDLFLITKVDPWTGSINSTYKSVLNSLNEAQLDYWDLVLIHTPESGRSSRLKAYEDLSKLVDQGKVKAIGLSNYGKHHIEELLSTNPRYNPVVNQIELHPFFFNDVATYCQSKNIIVQTYCPLARRYHLKDQNLVKIANEVNATPAQVMLKWAVNKGFVPLPKSGNPNRQQENADSLKIELNDQVMKQIDNLNRNDPVEFQCSVQDMP